MTRQEAIDIIEHYLQDRLKDADSFTDKQLIETARQYNHGDIEIQLENAMANADDFGPEDDAARVRSDDAKYYARQAHAWWNKVSDTTDPDRDKLYTEIGDNYAEEAIRTLEGN